MTRGKGPPMDRRRFWRTVLGSLVPKEGPPAPQPAPVPAAETPPPLRPPGAGSEPRFLSLCATGCRACVDACPRFVIIPSLDAAQPGGGDGRPYLLPDQAACDLCGLCMLACPTGALAPTPPAAVRIGLAVLDPAACVRTHGQPCDICLERCPYPQVALRDEGGLPTVLDAGCTGCGLCAEACPPRALGVVARG